MALGWISRPIDRKNQQVRAKKDPERARKRKLPIKFTFLRRYWDLGLEYIREICTVGSLHGINHFVAPNRHYFETLFWLAVVVLSFFCLVSLAQGIFMRYTKSPTVISLERDHLSWNITFPAATICLKRINETALEQVLDEYNVTDRDELKTFLIHLSTMSIESITDEEVEDHLSVKPEDYIETVNKILLGFTPQILSSLHITLQLEKTMIEMGLCYSLNSKLAVYNSPQYWMSNRWDYVERDVAHIHQLDGEQFIQLAVIPSAYDIYFHSPLEVPQVIDRVYHGEISTFRAVTLRLLNLYSTDDVRYLTPEQRTCRYLEERILTRSPVYSYNLCIMECRARKMLEICGCLPHFYRRLLNERICLVSELRCLYVYRSSLLASSRESYCQCMPTCNTNFFTIQENGLIEWDRWTQVKYGISDYPKFRLKREVIFGMKEVLINCGGAAGLLLGCSVLTIMEFIYFISLRLFWFCVRKYKNGA